MKTKAYLRVALTSRGTKVAASAKPNNAPLTDGNGWALPTVSFGIELDIPNALFDQASQIVASLRIPEEQAVIAAEVTQ